MFVQLDKIYIIWESKLERCENNFLYTLYKDYFYEIILFLYIIYREKDYKSR